MFYYSQHGDTDDEACFRDEEEGSIIKSLISQLRYVRVYSCNVLCTVKASDVIARRQGSLRDHLQRTISTLVERLVSWRRRVRMVGLYAHWKYHGLPMSDMRSVLS